MAVRGIQSNELDEFICRDDPSKTREDGATVFLCGTIPNAVITRITDQQSRSTVSFGDMNTQTLEQRGAFRNRECFRWGVKGWDNYFMGDGTPIIFETAAVMEGGELFHLVSEACLNKMLSATVQEVGTHVWKYNNMTDEQRKNSEALLSQFAALDSSSVATATQTNSESEDAPNQPSETTDKEGMLPPGAAVTVTAPSTTGKTPRQKNGKTPAPVA